MLRLPIDFYFVIVMPDFDRKLKSVEFLADKPDLKVNVMVSYADLVKHPWNVGLLRDLKERGLVGKIMLDSGAYLVLESVVDLDSYLRLARSMYPSFVEIHIDLFDFVIAPDVPCTDGNSTISNESRIEMTVENTIGLLSRVNDEKKVLVVV